MSQMRQPGMFDHSRDHRSAITTLTRDYPAGHVIALHFHDRDQLVYASRGVMTVRSRDGTWVVPPHRAVWIPAGVTAHCHDVWFGGDANAVSETTARKRASTRLLRDQRSRLAQRVGTVRMYVAQVRNSVLWQGHLIAIILHQLEASRRSHCNSPICQIRG